MVGADGFKLRMVFPTEGRWPFTVVAEKRHFAFPAITWAGRRAAGLRVLPEGSEAARAGAGGVWTQGPEVDASGSADPLPPETVAVAKPSDDGGGLPLWIPALGLACRSVAGLGVANRR